MPLRTTHIRPSTTVRCRAGSKNISSDAAHTDSTLTPPSNTQQCLPTRYGVGLIENSQPENGKPKRWKKGKCRTEKLIIHFHGHTHSTAEYQQNIHKLPAWEVGPKFSMSRMVLHILPLTLGPAFSAPRGPAGCTAPFLGRWARKRICTVSVVHSQCNVRQTFPA